MSGPATVYTAEQDLLIAGLTIACEKLRENVERITFEITSTESRIATSIHDVGVSMSDAEDAGNHGTRGHWQNSH